MKAGRQYALAERARALGWSDVLNTMRRLAARPGHRPSTAARRGIAPGTHSRLRPLRQPAGGAQCPLTPLTGQPELKALHLHGMAAASAEWQPIPASSLPPQKSVGSAHRGGTGPNAKPAACATRRNPPASRSTATCRVRFGRDPPAKGRGRALETTALRNAGHPRFLTWNRWTFSLNQSGT